VIDLMEVLRKSLKQGGGARAASATEDTSTAERPARRPARRAPAKRRSTAAHRTTRARKRA
jgi:hypothetical protein